MKAEILSLDKESIGQIDLRDDIFGLDLIRIDIIKRVVEWQRARAMSGTHKTKTTSEVSGSGKKPFKQKGTGNARQGSIRAVQMRGGGISHGPVVRSHEIKLPKKVRALGLKNALSSKFASGSLFVVDDLAMSEPKTSKLLSILNRFGDGKFFIIDGESVDKNFKLSSQGLFFANVVPAIGANVYDIIDSDYVILSKSALSILEGRLK